MAGYLAVAVFATWPLVLHPVGGFYGFGNDNLGGVWVYGHLHDVFFGHGTNVGTPELQAPFGYDIPNQVIQPMDRLYSILFGGFGQGLGAYNAQIFLSFVLAGCTMYLLARYLTGSRAAAAVAGFAYTFSPFHLAISMQYNSLAAIEWVPLFVLAVIVLFRRGRMRDAVLTGVAFAAVAATSYYYAWLVLWVILIVACAYMVGLAARHHRAGILTARAVLGFLRAAVLRVGVAAVVSVAILIPLILPSLRAARSDIVASQVNHPISEAVRYSVRPWMLFLPPHDQPLVDGRLERFVMGHLYEVPVYEQAVYLGYGLLLLATVALLRRRSSRVAPMTEAGSFARPLAIAGVLGGLLIMIGPYIPLTTGYWMAWSTGGGTPRIPSLGLLMFDITPNFRFYVRAFVMVSVCLCALGAIGMARLLGREGMGRRGRAALTVLALTVIGFEFTNAPPHRFLFTPTPAWVAAVRGLPGDGPIVDYPVATLNSPRSLYYTYWQRVHGKPTQNPASTPAALDLQAHIGAADDPAAGRTLSAAGIRYAVVHTALPPLTAVPYQSQLPNDALTPDVGARNPWFQRVTRTPDAVIYRVLRSPRRQVSGLVIRTASGFGAAEPEAGTTAQWIQADEGVIAIYGADGRRARLSLMLGSFARARRADFLLDGRRVARVTVPGEAIPVTVDLGVLSPGTHILILRATPGASLIGNGDMRSVSLRVRDLRLEVVR